jgi:hypothetical protein
MGYVTLPTLPIYFFFFFKRAHQRSDEISIHGRWGALTVTNHIISYDFVLIRTTVLNGTY